MTHHQRQPLQTRHLTILIATILSLMGCNSRTESAVDASSETASHLPEPVSQITSKGDTYTTALSIKSAITTLQSIEIELRSAAADAKTQTTASIQRRIQSVERTLDEIEAVLPEQDRRLQKMKAHVATRKSETREMWLKLQKYDEIVASDTGSAQRTANVATAEELRGDLERFEERTAQMEREIATLEGLLQFTRRYLAQQRDKVTELRRIIQL